MIYIVADVDPAYAEMICDIKNQETLKAKLCLCEGLRENGARLHAWRGLPPLRSAR